MSLSPGARLGPYEIVGLLGAGGMGEVYRARDTKLRRDVALKVLPDLFARDPERLARFTREAHVLASLNHPHIAAIYGIEEADGVTALVLELVEGPTLAEKLKSEVSSLKSERLPIAEALTIATQIADALDAAHEKGVVHRDLKPANIKLTADDRVKVLDFGLAKALGPADESRPDVSMSPTLTAMASKLGVIVGTAAYMSPEQAKGTPVDKRTDIWAFGCVLYEMLTGARAFAGDDVTEFIVSVMTKEPDWTRLPVSTPPRIVELLKRCLKKDPRERLRDIGDARMEINSAESASLPASQPSSPANRSQLLAWRGLSAALAALAVTFGVLYTRQPAPSLSLAKFQLIPPDKSTFGAIALSPDGHRIAFAAADPSGKSLLWLRSVDSLVSQPLAETEGASDPFWSPDSRFIGFFADHKLKKVGVDGGSPQTLCSLINDFGGSRGGSWGSTGVILFGYNPWGPNQLFQVPAAGSEPRLLTGLGPSGENVQRSWPSFLPDGRHFLFFARTPRREQTGVYVASLDSVDAHLLVTGESSAVYASGPQTASAGGYILFVRERTLMAQVVDVPRLTLIGDAVPIADQTGLDRSIGRSKVSVSDSGVLIYGSGTGVSQLVWFDRAGRRLGVAGPIGLDIDFRIAPDGKSVVAQREDALGGSDIWLFDLGRGTSSRVTLDPAYHAAPVWRPDGSRIALFTQREGRWQILEKSLSVASDERVLLKTANDVVPDDWSPDGRFLLYTDIDPKTRIGRIRVLSNDASVRQRDTTGLSAQTGFDENLARFSPDGRWFAYESNVSGRDEVYVRPFRADGSDGGPRQISSSGGTEPRWPRTGHELFYVGADNVLMAVDVKTSPTFEAGLPRALFPMRRVGVDRYDVSADGQKFLVATPTEEPSAPATVVLNWREELKRRTAANK